MDWWFINFICNPADPFTDLRAVQISVFQYLYKSSELLKEPDILLFSVICPEVHSDNRWVGVCSHSLVFTFDLFQEH